MSPVSLVGSTFLYLLLLFLTLSFSSYVFLFNVLPITEENLIGYFFLFFYLLLLFLTISFSFTFSLQWASNLQGKFWLFFLLLLAVAADQELKK